MYFFTAIVSPPHNYVAVSFLFFSPPLPPSIPFTYSPSHCPSAILPPLSPPFSFFLLLFLLFLLSLHSSPSPSSSSSLFLWFLLKYYHINEDYFFIKNIFYYLYLTFAVGSLSHVVLFVTPWTAAH